MSHKFVLKSGWYRESAPEMLVVGFYCYYCSLDAEGTGSIRPCPCLGGTHNLMVKATISANYFSVI